METTTNFIEWLRGSSRPKTSYDLYALWQASLGRSCGPYTASIGPSGQTHIVGMSRKPLVLTSERANAAFKRAIETIRVKPMVRTLWTEIEANQLAAERPDRVTVRVPTRNPKLFRK